MDTKEKLSNITVLLHWLVAAGMIGLLGLGFYMATLHVLPLYPIHKALGVIMLFPILIRIFWRLFNGWPSSVSSGHAWEKFAARLIHWLLIVCTLLMPITGMMNSGFGGFGISIFGWELIARNPDPSDAAKVLAHHPLLSNFGRAAHAWTGYVLVVAIFVHLAAAVKHHVFDRDLTLVRMLSRS